MPHGIKFAMPNNKTNVSCECRAVWGKHDRTGKDRVYYEPMPVAEDEPTLFDTYNNPENHWEEFLSDDRIKT